MPSDAAHEMELAITQLMDVLNRMGNYLAGGVGQNPRARLETLEQTSHEAEWIKVIEEITAAHGLVELRPSLDAVIERLESSRFEVAVFGRVNSGKSSLFNHILRTEVLPVGVTPVTALPTYIVFGSRPLARIWFAEAAPIVIETHELRQYATEQGNPGNTKHVTRIQVELPADRLNDGVIFVDTPGLGSLARYGEMETMAYLPRCDLGAVLIDATSTLVHDDAFTVNSLRQAGASVMVLLTKIDVLSPDERATALQYTKDQLPANLGFDPPVSMVSVKDADAELSDRWIEAELVPCLREHQKLAKASVRRKVGLLREAAISALQRRLENRAVAKPLTQLRENLMSILGDASAAVGQGREEISHIPIPMGMPILDLAALLHEVPLRRPLLAALGSGKTSRKVRRQLFAQVGPQMNDFLGQYARRVEQWRLRVLAEMRRAFTAGADFLRVRFERTSTCSDAGSIDNDLRRLQALQGDGQE